MKEDKAVHCLAIGDGGNDINMIQSAHIGIGIEGNEGNQAAYFSDYSIPNFQGLRRLVLWHGLQFGKKSFTVFIPLKIFIGHLFMTPIFYHNWRNGFSGGILYDSYYYGLFGVTMTNLALMNYMFFDTEVDYDFKSYLKELLPDD